jgi:hypothetical protein
MIEAPERVIEPQVVAPTWIRSVAAWALYLGVSVLVLRPILITTIVADDFLNPFSQLTEVGLSPWEMIEYGWDAASSVGHFNYLGQVFGALYTGLTMWLASEFGIRFSTMYAVVKLAVFIGTAVAAGALLREFCAFLGVGISTWRSRVLVSAILFSTLQLHNFWSNDPVGSYPTSGFGAAILGLIAMFFGVRAVRLEHRWSPAVAGLAATAALLYYEINVAVVAALAVLVAFEIVMVDSPDRRRRLVRLAPMVAIPLAVVVILQLRSTEASANYEGTTVNLGGTLFATFGKSLVSSLPASAWNLSREYLQGSVMLRSNAVATLAVAAAVVATVAARSAIRRSTQPAPESPSWWKVGAVVATLVTYWTGATFIQSATAKVQAEVTRIGQVYNYYAIGATVIAIILALAFHLYARHVPKALVPALLVMVATFVITQFMITWNLSERFNAATAPNRSLLVAYTEQWSTEERCEALWNWSAGAWPDYYELGMIEGLDVAYRRFHGEPFCDGFVRPP